MTRDPADETENLIAQVKENDRRDSEQDKQAAKRTVQSPDALRRKEEASRQADKYCSKDGGKPDLEALVQLKPMEYGAVRKAIADRMGVPVKFVDEEVAARKSTGGLDGLPPDPDPWPEPILGQSLIAEIIQTIRRYMVMGEGMAETVALWIIFTHLHDCFEISPALAVTSPSPVCGKTTLQTIVGALVPRPLPASNITGPSIFRSVDKWKPTMVIDEADTFIKDSDGIRGILDSGHNRRNAWVVRTQGEQLEPRRFSTWAPKSIALLGKLPPTLSSRSLHIKLQRKLPIDQPEKLFASQVDKLIPLHQKIARWAADNAEAVKGRDPAMPSELQSRTADNWRPLIAIADQIGFDWPKKVRDIAVKAAAEAGDDIYGIALLSCIQSLFNERNVEALHSEDIADALGKIEGSPWAEWGKQQKPITKNQIARLLAPFDIHPKQVWANSPDQPLKRNLNGYELATLKPVFDRYIVGGIVPQPSKPLDPKASKGLEGEQTSRPESALEVQNSRAQTGLEFPTDSNPKQGNGSRGLDAPQTILGPTSGPEDDGDPFKGLKTPSLAPRRRP